MRLGVKLVLLEQKMYRALFALLTLFPGLIYASSCVVLLYHNISDITPKSTSVSPKLFEQHLKYLSEKNYNVISLSRMVEGLKLMNLPEKCVSLTADDANESIYSNAFPLLKKYNLPLSVFVSTGSIDMNYPSMMSWQQMRNMQNKNIYFYNHSVSHPYLINMKNDEIYSQITKAQLRLEQELGVKENFFAYPYGEENIEIIQLLEGLGYVSFGQQSGAISYNNDMSNLPRFPMSFKFADMSSFITKINTLPMPVIHKRVNSVVPNNNPILNLEFVEPLSNSKQKQFACYAGGSNTKVDWKSNKIVSIQANNELPSRRFRYNCTMPSGEGNRYYWFSKQFIKENKD